MSKLKLTDVKKTYGNGEIVHALKGISLEFRKSELVSILGPSGCGKTSLLNIIGGLDRYDSGDLMLDDLSTKNFKDDDWDAYRNHSIGFVFQSYNLIPHQTILQNVEIAMTLSGVSASERKQRAKEALTSVGLADQIKKKPSQLSGGQMQRVAIARALVNNPDIILADEPTGALDSHTSEQVMEILKEISKSKLVIMVTHNGELADKYSSRVIHLRDGGVQSDSNPLFKDEFEKRQKEAKPSSNKKVKLKKTSMSLFTATSLSFKNLLTKKGRTIITSFAGSIGIIGVALVLALSNGLSIYMTNTQQNALSGFPISVSTSSQNVDVNQKMQAMAMDNNANSNQYKAFTADDVIYNYDSNANTVQHTNVLTQDYLDYVAKLPTEVPDAVSNISYTRGVDINLLVKGESSVQKFNTTAYTGNIRETITGANNKYWSEMPDNKDFILGNYDLIGEGSRLPSKKNEVALVVDEYNRLDSHFLEKLGMNSNTKEYKLSDFIGKKILKVIPNNNFYTKNADGLYSAIPAANYENLYDSNVGLDLTITGILRVKDGAPSNFLSEGIVYPTALTDYIVDNASKSDVAIAQKASDKDIILNTPFANDDAKKARLQSLGANTTPTAINIYPKDFASKDKIKTYLDSYNTGKADENKVIYTDLAETINNMMNSLIKTISYVLIGFAAISLLVSTIMIGIITYISVLERTKEIGILRSVGARKKDIGRVFNAETMIVGCIAGLLGVGLSYLLILPINMLIKGLANIPNLANLNPISAIVLILGSMVLTLIAGLIPSRMAAKKDPVRALRSE